MAIWKGEGIEPTMVFSIIECVVLSLFLQNLGVISVCVLRYKDGYLDKKNIDRYLDRKNRIKNNWFLSNKNIARLSYRRMIGENQFFNITKFAWNSPNMKILLKRNSGFAIPIPAFDPLFSNANTTQWKKYKEIWQVQWKYLTWNMPTL